MPATLEALPRPFITKENAAELAQKSIAARKLRKEARKSLLKGLAQKQVEALPDAYFDPLISNLTRAMRETLSKCINADNAKEASAYARALRDLREVWHMVTGQPKPGLRKMPVEKPARLMLSPAVDAGHAQPASMESTKPVSDTTEPAP